MKNKPLKHRGSSFNNLWGKMWTSSSIPKSFLFHLFTIKILLDNQNKRKISREKGRQRKQKINKNFSVLKPRPESMKSENRIEGGGRRTPGRRWTLGGHLANSGLRVDGGHLADGGIRNPDSRPHPASPSWP